MTATYSPGQQVWLCEQGREPRQVPVVKVGRKLVTVEYHGRPVTYRIDTGRINDNYGRSHIRTAAQLEADRRLGVVRARLQAHRAYSLPPGLSVEALEAIADIIDADLKGSA